LSNTLTKSEGELADLIIHELTHATLFVKDDAEFNENLASFIGNQGALQFLAHYYGSESQQYQDYARFISDQDELTHFYVAAAESLDSLYLEMAQNSNLTAEEKRKQKEEHIQKIMIERKALNLFSFKYSPWQEGDELPNNTFFTGFLMYRSNQNDLKSELENKFDGNLRLFIRSYVERYGNSGVQL
jgi:predicted aminopeptidase